jgi:hypothetical protein
VQDEEEEEEEEADTGLPEYLTLRSANDPLRQAYQLQSVHYTLQNICLEIYILFNRPSVNPEKRIQKRLRHPSLACAPKHSQGFVPFQND